MALSHLLLLLKLNVCQNHSILSSPATAAPHFPLGTGPNTSELLAAPAAPDGPHCSINLRPLTGMHFCYFVYRVLTHLLCDGCCKRAFHERCCNPPVRIADLEEDEGWLCPACDCKVRGGGRGLAVPGVRLQGVGL